MAGNADNLRKAAQRKSQATSRRADLAIREMVKHGERITFRGVARTAGCSIDFVYRNLDIRARIEHLRAQQQGSPPDRTPKGDARLSDSSIVRTLTAQLAELKRRHHREVTELRTALAAAQGEILNLRRQGAHTYANP
jgi:hypothetical protein